MMYKFYCTNAAVVKVQKIAVLNFSVVLIYFYATT